MAISTDEFWKLCQQSDLLTKQQCQQYQEGFGGVKGAAQQGNALTLSEWLISQNVISRYQATILLAGRAGPFVYGNYKVYDREDQGRLGGMFRAVHIQTGYPVLLHFVDPKFAKQNWNSIVQACRTSLETVHLNLVRFHDLVDLVSYKYLVLEDLRGQSLAEQYHATPLPMDQACRAICHAATGLAHLHAGGLVHGDIYPDHLWAGTSGNVKLYRDPLNPPTAISFGGATHSQALLRRADYLAPELTSNNQQPTSLGDIYALGCTMYHLLTGHAPFAGGDLQQKMTRHANEPIEPLEQYGIVQPVAQIVAYMMAKDQSVRYQQAGQIADGLRGLFQSAVLNITPEQPPATLQAYQNRLTQHQSELAAKAKREAEQSPFQFDSPQSTVADDVQFNLNFNDQSTTSTAVKESTKTKAVAINSIKTETESSDTTSSKVGISDRIRQNKSSTKRMAIIFGSCGAALILAIFLVFKFLPGEESNGYSSNKKSNSSKKSSAGKIESSTKTPQKPNGNKKPSIKPNPTPKKEIKEILVADDEQRLWQSPTSGEPLDLSWTEENARAFISLRPSELIIEGEEAHLISALGPEATAAIAKLEKTIGLELSKIQQITIAFYAEKEDQPPRASYVVRVAEPLKLSELKKNLTDVEMSILRDENKTKLLANETHAYFLPAAEKGKLLVISTPIAIQKLVENQGSAPSLGTQMNLMLKTTDADRSFTLLVEPQFLFGDGREIFVGILDKLRTPLQIFLGDEVRALALSFHIDDDTFLELRISGMVTRDIKTVVETYHQRVQNLPKKIGEYVDAIEISKHSRTLMRKYPQMLYEFASYQRTGIDDDQVVMRCYLPDIAAHNLIMASELALQEGRGHAATSGTKSTDTQPKTVAEKLKKIISLQFTQDTLQISVAMVGKEIQVPVVILGGDLQLKGITQNQSFGLDEQNKSAEAVLLKILLGARPDGELIYVIKANPADGGKQTIFITTREAANKRGDKLPLTLQKK